MQIANWITSTQGKVLLPLLALAAVLTPATTLAGGLTTFDNGYEGWVGPTGMGGITFIDTSGGNPAPSLRTQFVDFGITFHNSTNPDFVGDYTATPVVDISVDTNTVALNYLGLPTPRDFIVELRDYDNPPAGYPWVSVWTSLGVLDENNPGWHTWGVTIEDTSAVALPDGWGGYGAEDPVTYEPVLPPDRTFTDVLAGVDEIALTTFVPGYFYSDSYYDVALDNISVALTPEPTAGLLLLIGGLTCLSRRR